MLSQLLLFTVAISQVAAFYQNTDVIEMDAKQFKNQVLKGDELWLVEFYAPWCGHCKNLIPEYKKVATAVKGVARVGAVDGTGAGAEDLMRKYDVKGFPTIKFFGANKRAPKDYEGQRTGDAMISEVVKQVGRMVKERTKGGSSSKSSKGDSGGSGQQKAKASGSGSKRSTSAVVELTDTNFNALVMESQDLWLVEFFAPWCGHCKNLAPEWESAAKQLKGSGVQLGAVDATEHQSLASKYGVKGYPTIKTFPAGKKKKAKDYQGPREAAGIVSYAHQELDQAGVPPSTPQITSDAVFQDACTGNQKLCVIMFVPHLLDSLAKGRNQYLDTLTSIAKSMRGSPFQFAWSEGGVQTKLEDVMGLTFGYPAMVVLSAEKKVYAVQRGSWSKKNLVKFLNNVISGSEKTTALSVLPKIKEVAAWDGKDAYSLISEEEYSLEDLMGDDEL